jgi:DNA (cytosine-5)-methyltransferase 1
MPNPQLRLVGSEPTLVSLFAGGGGLDIGLEDAGFRTVCAVDVDARCVETLEANKARGIISRLNRAPLSDAAILRADVAKLDGAAIMEASGLGVRPTLMAGGPPCQPFSSSGKMLGLDDPRGRLFEHYVRIASELLPDYILFENVRGLITAKGPTGRHGETLDMVRDAFEGIGYATSFALLNSADFGAPQRRVRIFMLGARDRALPDFPSPTHAQTRDGTSERLPWVPLETVLDRSPPPEDVVRPTAALAALLASVRPGSGMKSSGAKETTRPGGHWGYRQGTFVCDPSRPARTVTASSAQDWLKLQDGSHRRLTWRECARLQGFPEEWIFAGARDDRQRQVGNAVPVAFGAALGRSILEALDEGRIGQVASKPFPTSFAKAARSTARENVKNGGTRAVIRELKMSGGDVSHLKGTGRA